MNDPRNEIGLWIGMALVAIGAGLIWGWAGAGIVFLVWGALEIAGAVMSFYKPKTGNPK